MVILHHQYLELQSLIELRILDFNLSIEFTFLISSLSLLYSLVQCGKKDISNDLVLAEKVSFIWN